MASPQNASQNATFESWNAFPNRPDLFSVRMPFGLLIPWRESTTAPLNIFLPGHLPNIRVPLLIAAMGAAPYIRDNEIHYEVAASQDKDFVVIERAEHGQTPCVRCGSFSRASYSPHRGELL